MKNLTLFQFSTGVAQQLSSLDAVVREHMLRPCGPIELSTQGFVGVMKAGESDVMTRQIDDAIFLTAGSEEKILPSAVITDHLEARIKKLVEQEGRQVGSRERRRLKEEVVSDLLPKAFSRRTYVSLFLDTRNGLCAVDTASRKKAEAVITQLREALGSFPAMPLAPEESPRVVMTDWLRKGELPSGLSLGDECELRDPAEGGARWKGRKADLQSEDVLQHLKDGLQVFQLGLVLEDRISFVLSGDLIVRKLKFLDLALDQMSAGEDEPIECDAHFFMVSGEVRQLFSKLNTVFGLKQSE